MCLCCRRLYDGTIINCWEQCFSRTPQPLSEVSPTLKTGDCLLFRCSPGYRWAGQYMLAASPWDHVGIIWVHEGKPYVIDTAPFRYWDFCFRPLDFGEVPSEEWQKGGGPQMCLLKDFIKAQESRGPVDYKGDHHADRGPWHWERLAVRRLQNPLTLVPRHLLPSPTPSLPPFLPPLPPVSRIHLRALSRSFAFQLLVRFSPKRGTATSEAEVEKLREFVLEIRDHPWETSEHETMFAAIDLPACCEPLSRCLAGTDFRSRYPPARLSGTEPNCVPELYELRVFPPPFQGLATFTVCFGLRLKLDRWVARLHALFLILLLPSSVPPCPIFHSSRSPLLDGAPLSLSSQGNISSLFCSETVAACYLHLGLLPPDPPSNEYVPAADFSPDHGSNWAGLSCCCFLSWWLARSKCTADLRNHKHGGPLFQTETEIRIPIPPRGWYSKKVVPEPPVMATENNQLSKVTRAGSGSKKS